ncbi:hypothetical protein OH76DRAFT_520873 [Lentinus brumalis]|uniref:Uncharacterized protein n=1 Tax=Lentinus brumalis TaxID=2498619 RepID=A0A371DAQ5_9APHY|nr:hypothetical protein OH76DRAFT_520873 [Polyporus brumalis]
MVFGEDPGKHTRESETHNKNTYQYLISTLSSSQWPYSSTFVGTAISSSFPFTKSYLNLSRVSRLSSTASLGLLTTNVPLPSTTSSSEGAYQFRTSTFRDTRRPWRILSCLQESEAEVSSICKPGCSSPSTGASGTSSDMPVTYWFIPSRTCISQAVRQKVY